MGNMITDEMRKYKNHIKYRVDNFDIIFENGDIEEINGDMVTHLYIEKDYDELYFPIVNISVTMKDELYHRINQENDTVKFRVRVIKNIYDRDFKLLKYELCFNELFQCFKNKKNVIEDNKSKESKEEGEGTTAVTLGTNVRDFYIFTDEVLKCKKMYNLSIESATMSDLLIYMIGEAGIDKLLMTKLDNNEQLNNFLIPSGDLIECINYLNNLKSFYKKGMQLFFDIDTAYLVDKNCNCTCWRKNEVRITHIHITNQEVGDSQLNGYYIDKDRKQTHLFANTGRVSMANTNIVSNQLTGNNVKIVDSKGNSTNDIKTNTTSVGNNNEKILAVKNGAKYTASDLQLRIEENEYICRVILIGVDSEVVTPNKEIVMTFEDVEINKQYGGKYRVNRVISALKKDGSELIGELQVEMKKQE